MHKLNLTFDFPNLPHTFIKVLMNLFLNINLINFPDFFIKHSINFAHSL